MGLVVKGGGKNHTFYARPGAKGTDKPVRVIEETAPTRDKSVQEVIVLDETTTERDRAMAIKLGMTKTAPIIKAKPTVKRVISFKSVMPDDGDA